MFGQVGVLIVVLFAHSFWGTGKQHTKFVGEPFVRQVRALKHVVVPNLYGYHGYFLLDHFLPPVERHGYPRHHPIVGFFIRSQNWMQDRIVVAPDSFASSELGKSSHKIQLAAAISYSRHHQQPEFNFCYFRDSLASVFNVERYRDFGVGRFSLITGQQRRRCEKAATHRFSNFVFLSFNEDVGSLYVQRQFSNLGCPLACSDQFGGQLHVLFGSYCASGGRVGALFRRVRRFFSSDEGLFKIRNLSFCRRGLTIGGYNKSLSFIDSFSEGTPLKNREERIDSGCDSHNPFSPESVMGWWLCGAATIACMLLGFYFLGAGLWDAQFCGRYLAGAGFFGLGTILTWLGLSHLTFGTSSIW